MVNSLANQPAADVLAKEEQIVAFINETYPEYDLSPGTVLRDIVIRIYAHLETRLQEKLDLATYSSSLLEISKDPSIADSAQVDRVLSNFNVSRSEGGKATGKVRLMLSSNESFVINVNTVFTISGKTFVPVTSFVLLKPENATGAPNERLFSTLGAYYSVLIDVVATSSGASGNIRGGTALTSISPNLKSYVSGKADADFSGGADADTNEVLLTKMKTGVVGKAFSGREHIKAKLKAQFPGVVDCGVVGMLDPEMTRDIVDGLHTGNRVDLYVKTARYPSRILDTVTATLVSYDLTLGGLFEFTVDKENAAGLYLVESIRSEDSQAGSYEIVEDTRLSIDSSLHVTPSATDFTFSAYQTVKIRFRVPPSNMSMYAYALAPSTTAVFQVTYLQAPNIAEVQNYVDSPAERSLTADMLVKGPIPALSSVCLRIRAPGTGVVIDENAVKAAVTNTFNSYEIGSKIPGSALVHAAYGVIPVGCYIDLPIQMYAVLVRPDLSRIVLQSTSDLVAPNEPTRGVSKNTVAFYLEASQVDVTVEYCQ